MGLQGLSFRLLLFVTLGAFAGYALLLPIVPMWAVAGGASTAGAGATNGVFMLVTVLTQLAMPWVLRRWDHRWVLGAGTLLIGLPTPLFAVSTHLGLLLAVSGVRGIGFGMLTVTGSALVAELVPVALRGRASGLYGLAVGLPNVLCLPVGVWLVQRAGFDVLFWLAGAVPCVAAAVALWIRPADIRSSSTRHTITRTVQASLLAPWTMMLCTASTAGGLVAFLPLAVPRLASPALLLFGIATVAGRWVAGVVGDRIGSHRAVLPSVLTAVIGTAGMALATSGMDTLALAGALLLGAGFGALQNATLVVMFDRAESGSASAVWNIAYDAGNGIGSVGFGILVGSWGYSVTFGIAAAVIVASAPLVLACRPAPATPARRMKSADGQYVAEGKPVSRQRGRRDSRGANPNHKGG